MSISGDRHLRPEQSGKIKGLLAGPRTVLVQANSPYACSFAGQVLLQLLVNLLCRQFGVIDLVKLDIPPAPVDRRAFPIPVAEQDMLVDQLVAWGQTVGGGEVGVEPANGANRANITVRVGPALEPTSISPFTVVAFGDGWNAFCSSVERTPDAGSTSLVPFGPLLGACLAAGMVFRQLHQVATLHTSDSGLWNFGQGQWSTGGGPTLSGVRLPSAHLIGLGAVGAAFGLALAMAPGLSGALVGIDPQVTDPTGRNRLLSASYDEVGLPKVALAARFFERTGIRFYSNESRWPDYATDSERRSPSDVRCDEDSFRYPWIISCVDRNLDRQNIARYLPRHVLSGSTDGLVAQATYYAMDGPCECLACNHPVPTYSLEELVEELKDLSPSERQVHYEGQGLAPAVQAAIDEYLFNPSCGHAAEAELRRLGVEGTTDWSVGFVSASAGIMLAAYFARCAADGVDVTVDEHPERRLIFLGAQELSKSRARRKADCLVCGSGDVRSRFARRWGRDRH